MAGAASGIGIGAYLGWGRAKKNTTWDAEDRIGFTASSAIFGGAAGLGIGAVGVKGIRGAASSAFDGINNTRKIVSGSISRLSGSKWKGISQLKGPMAFLAFTAASVGLMAYGSRPNPQTTAYGSPDEMGGTQYSENPIKRRVGLLGATGNMVFGMNNSRHG